MYSFITILLANFKKRKAQSFLAAIIIIAAAILFTTAIGTITSINEPFEDMYREANASQIQAVNFNEIYNTNDIIKWWSEQEGITVQTFKCYSSSDNLEYKGQKISGGSVIYTEKPNSKLTQDKLTIVKGEQRDCPAEDEVWICISFADRFKMQVGDMLGISTKNGMQQKRISAIITDPQFGSPSMGSTRLWIAPGQIDKLFSDKTLKGFFIGLHFNDYSKRAELWNSFEKAIGGPYTSNIFDYELVSMAYIAQYQYMGIILMLFSVVLVVIAVIIVCFTISTSVASDIKIIGVLKSQGFTPMAITMLYTVQYTVLSLVSIVIGILLSNFTVKAITNMITRAMGISSIDISLVLAALITLITLMSIVSLASYLTARKAGKLKPVKAIRQELISAKKSIGIGIGKMRFASVSVLVAIRQCFTQKAQSLILLLITFAMAAVFTYSINLVNTFNHIYENAPDWGHDKRSDTVVLKESASPSLRKNILDNMKNDKRIKFVIPAAYGGSECRVESDDSSKYKNVFISIYDGDIDKIGAQVVKGRNALKDNEVAISPNVERVYNKTVGDYINVCIGGKRQNLLITGVYQTTNYMGWGIRCQKSVVQNVIPNYYINNYALIFMDEAARESFISEYMKQYDGQLEIQPFEELIDTWMYGIKSGVNAFVVFLTIVFIAVMVIIIFNSTLINIYKDKKSYGVYKSIGLTPVQIRKTILFRIAIIAALGSLIAIPIVYFSTDNLMTMMLSGMGISSFRMRNNIPGTMMVLPICVAIAVLGCWVPSGRVRNISARELIME